MGGRPAPGIRSAPERAKRARFIPVVNPSANDRYLREHSGHFPNAKNQGSDRLETQQWAYDDTSELSAFVPTRFAMFSTPRGAGLESGATLSRPPRTPSQNFFTARSYLTAHGTAYLGL